MYTVIFVCLGNICRSPMAEAVFKKLIAERGIAGSFSVSSFATSDCEEGNPIYPPAAKVLKEHGYHFEHRAKKISPSDIKNADYVLCMDEMNRSALLRIAGENYCDKIFLLGSFSGLGEIDDPWYTRDFNRTYAEVCISCNAFLDYFSGEHAHALKYDGGH